MKHDLQLSVVFSVSLSELSPPSHVPVRYWSADCNVHLVL